MINNIENEISKEINLPEINEKFKKYFSKSDSDIKKKIKKNEDKLKKEIEDKLKKERKLKPKSIKISGKQYASIAEHCEKLNVKVSDWLEYISSLEINRVFLIGCEKETNNTKENITIRKINEII